MFNNFDEMENLDNIELMERQRKNYYFLGQTIFASMLML